MESNSSHLKTCKSKISTEKDGVYHRGTPATLCNYKSHKWASHPAYGTSAITIPLAHAAGLIDLFLTRIQCTAFDKSQCKKSTSLTNIRKQIYKIVLICRRKIQWNLLDNLHSVFNENFVYLIGSLPALLILLLS